MHLCTCGLEYAEPTTIQCVTGIRCVMALLMCGICNDDFGPEWRYFYTPTEINVRFTNQASGYRLKAPKCKMTLFPIYIF